MARLPGGVNRYAAVTAGLFLWGVVGAVAAAVDVALALLLLALADHPRAPAAARPVAAEQKPDRLGWLGSGAAFFWIVLPSIRTLMP